MMKFRKLLRAVWVVSIFIFYVLVYRFFWKYMYARQDVSSMIRIPADNTAPETPKETAVHVHAVAELLQQPNKTETSPSPSVNLSIIPNPSPSPTQSKEQEKQPIVTPTTTTTTTTTANMQVPVIAAATPEEEAFYKHHNEQMNLLVNESSLLNWNRDRRRKGKYHLWLENFEFLQLGNNVDLASIEGIHNHHYFRHDGKEGICIAAKAFQKYWNASKVNANTTTASKPLPRLPHILLGMLNQDSGAFSSQIKGKTIKTSPRKGDLKKVWEANGCSEQMVFEYLDHPDTLAVFTIQYQSYDHPKVISLPLGLSAGGHGSLLSQVKIYSPNRTQLLMVNSLEKRIDRANQINIVTQTFQNEANITLVNTYNKYSKNQTGAAFCESDHVIVCYYREMLQSKFILSPGGLGLDCYRIWEAIYMGTIPVLERNYRKTDGWFNRLITNFPVAWVDDYSQLTPAVLESEYRRLVYDRNPQSYKYEKMTRQYWIHMAKSLVEEHTQNQEGRE